MSAELPSWSEIKQTHPELAARLAKDRYDHDALVEYLRLTLGADVVARHEHGR